MHTIQDLTDLAGEFWLKGKLSLRREWSGRSVLTNGKRPRYPDQPCDSSRDQSDNEPTPLFSEGIQAEIKKDLINYRLKLQSEVGRSSVGSVALSSGFSINLIDLVLQHLPKLTSVEKVEEILPVYSSKIATDIFCIIQKHTSPQALA